MQFLKMVPIWIFKTLGIVAGIGLLFLAGIGAVAIFALWQSRPHDWYK